MKTKVTIIAYRDGFNWIVSSKSVCNTANIEPLHMSIQTKEQARKAIQAKWSERYDSKCPRIQWA